MEDKKYQKYSGQLRKGHGYLALVELRQNPRVIITIDLLGVIITIDLLVATPLKSWLSVFWQFYANDRCGLELLLYALEELNKTKRVQSAPWAKFEN